MKKIISIFQIYLILLLSVSLTYAQEDEPDFSKPETYVNMNPNTLASHIDVNTNIDQVWTNYAGDRQALWNALGITNQRRFWDTSSNTVELWGELSITQQRGLLSAEPSNAVRARAILKTPELVPNLGQYLNQFGALYNVNPANYDFGASFVTLIGDEQLRLPTGELLNFATLRPNDRVEVTSLGHSCWVINGLELCPGTQGIIERTPMVVNPDGGAFSSDFAYNVVNSDGTVYTVDLSSVDSGDPLYFDDKGRLNVPRGAIIYPSANRAMSINGPDYEIRPHPSLGNKFKTIFADGETEVNGRDIEFHGSFVAVTKLGHVISHSCPQKNCGDDPQVPFGEGTRIRWDNTHVDFIGNQGNFEYRAVQYTTNAAGVTTSSYMNTYKVPLKLGLSQNIRIGGEVGDILDPLFNVHISDDGETARNDGILSQLLWKPMVMPGVNPGGTTGPITINGIQNTAAAAAFENTPARNLIRTPKSLGQIINSQRNIQTLLNNGRFEEARREINQLPLAQRERSYEDFQRVANTLSESQRQLHLDELSQDIINSRAEIPQYAFGILEGTALVLIAGFANEVLGSGYNSYHTLNLESSDKSKTKSLGGGVSIVYQGQKTPTKIDWRSKENYQELVKVKINDQDLGLFLLPVGGSNGLNSAANALQQANTLGRDFTRKEAIAYLERSEIRRAYNLQTNPQTSNTTVMDASPWTTFLP